jgi:hypothetical protein
VELPAEVLISEHPEHHIEEHKKKRFHVRNAEYSYVDVKLSLSTP